MATRATTAPELLKLRGDGQKSKLYLAIRKPTTIYTARVNGAPASNDNVGQVVYDGGTGTLANVKVGMAMYVGTSAGARDLGTVRIRKAPAANIFYIGMESDVAWADNAYLTIVDEHELRLKHSRVVTTTTYMDFDEIYSDQHSAFDPVPVLGSDAVLWRTGATVSITWPSAAGSYVPDGSAVSSYLWTAPGASATSGLNTATPTFTYNADGQYKVYCQVTAANGKTFEGNRTIFVFSAAAMPEVNFRVTDPARGSYEDGGWGFEVEMVAEGDISAITDRTKVILFAEDWYGDTKSSIGPVSGFENIVCTGWIEGETIRMDAENGTMTFRVAGAQELMKNMTGQPVVLERRSAGANGWINVQSLTVRMMAWHLLHWRSTATAIMDVHLTSDTRMDVGLDNQTGKLWTQLKTAGAKILAEPVADRYGALYFEINQQVVPAAGRSAWPVTMTLTKADWRDSLRIDRRITTEGGRVELSGRAIIGAAEPQAYYSLAPGHTAKQFGEVVSLDNMLVISQAGANQMAGLYLGYINRKYDFEFSLAQNNRMIDIAPSSFIGMNIAAGDNLRGIAYVGNCVPREVTIEYDENGAPKVTVMAQQESVEDLSQIGDMPDTGETLPPIPPIPPLPPLPPLPPGPLPDPSLVKTVVIHVREQGFFYTKDFDQESPHWYAMNGGLDQYHIDRIKYFDVTASGVLYAYFNAGGFDKFGTASTAVWNMGGPGTIDIKQEIWRSPAVGEPWVKTFDNTQLTPDGAWAFPRGPQLNAMGVERNAGDSITVLGTAVYTIGGDTISQVWRGGTSLSKISPSSGVGVNIVSISDPLGTLIKAGDGSWIFAGKAAGGSIQRVFKLNAAGTSLTTIETGFTGVPVVVTARVLNALALYLTTPVHVSLDSGASWTTDAMTYPTPYGYNAGSGLLYQSLGSDATGQRILLGDEAGILLKKSSDGGATWGNAPSIAGTTTAVWNVGYEEVEDGPDLDCWIIGMAHMVRFSVDFFDTYSEKTGDLWTWTGSLADIMSIRVADAT